MPTNSNAIQLRVFRALMLLNDFYLLRAHAVGGVDYLGEVKTSSRTHAPSVPLGDLRRLSLQSQTCGLIKHDRELTRKL